MSVRTFKQRDPHPSLSLQQSKKEKRELSISSLCLFVRLEREEKGVILDENLPINKWKETRF